MMEKMRALLFPEPWTVRLDMKTSFRTPAMRQASSTFSVPTQLTSKNSWGERLLVPAPVNPARWQTRSGGEALKPATVASRSRTSSVSTSLISIV